MEGKRYQRVADGKGKGKKRKREWDGAAEHSYQPRHNWQMSWHERCLIWWLHTGELEAWLQNAKQKCHRVEAPPFALREDLEQAWQ